MRFTRISNKYTFKNFIYKTRICFKNTKVFAIAIIVLRKNCFNYNVSPVMYTHKELKSIFSALYKYNENMFLVGVI